MNETLLRRGPKLIEYEVLIFKINFISTETCVYLTSVTLEYLDLKLKCKVALVDVIEYPQGIPLLFL